MDSAVHLFLPIAIGLMMLSLGLGLTVQDFGRVVQWPKAFLVGLACQFLMFPLIAFGVVKGFGLTGSLAVGVMLLASCPGGSTSNLFTKFVRGNVALSISLTSVSTLASVVTVPFILKWSEHHFLASGPIFLDLKGLAGRAFLLSVLPIMLGIAIRHVAPALAQRAGRVLTKVTIGLLAVIIVGAVMGNWTPFVANLWRLGGALASLFFLLVAFGLFVPLAMGLGVREAKTVSIELGVQNGAFGITIATLLTQTSAGFNDYSLASAIYGVLVYFAILPVLFGYRALASRAEAAA